VKLPEVVKLIPFAELVEFAISLIQHGVPKDEVKDTVAHILDLVIPFDLLIPGPIGAGLEKVDDKLFKGLVDIVFAVAHKRAAK